MWDWEDAGGDYKDQLYRAWQNLADLLAHKWDGKPFVHPAKNRTYAIEARPDAWPTIFHRAPGLHLRNRQISLDGEEVPAMIPALVIHILNNFESQKKNGSGVYFYVPKIETWKEARLVGTLLKHLEEAVGLRRGSLKIKMLNERAEYALQQEVIMWVLRENLIGPNVGRWDYISSREEMFRNDPAMVIPDPNTVVMTEPSMSYYTMRNALLALLARKRREGASRHLVRQAAGAVDRTVPHQRDAARHLPSELGRDHREGLRRCRTRTAGHER
jgi:malate synthase